jgi:hypothetical protein
MGLVANMPPDAFVDDSGCSYSVSGGYGIRQFCEYVAQCFPQLPAPVHTESNASYDVVGGTSTATGHTVLYGVIQGFVFNFGVNVISGDNTPRLGSQWLVEILLGLRRVMLPDENGVEVCYFYSHKLNV